jgi:hypothetical protein
MMKKFIFVFLIFLTSCVQEVIEPIPDIQSNIFSQKENQIGDKGEMSFNLEYEGVYFISLIDIESKQVISREKILGVKGTNKLNIYTKTIESRYLYLVLVDNNRVELNRTTLILK